MPDEPIIEIADVDISSLWAHHMWRCIVASEDWLEYCRRLAEMKAMPGHINCKCALPEEAPPAQTQTWRDRPPLF